MKARCFLVIRLSGGILLLLAAGASMWARTALRGLAYDGVHTFVVGSHPVSIETQSYRSFSSERL